ncbi:MAG: hypothetical protein NVSMB48_02560 [Marmoricola sp.]
MWFSLLVLLMGLAVAGLTMLYVSYPRRGQAVPRVPWLGEAMQRRVEALPTVVPEGEVGRELGRR